MGCEEYCDLKPLCGFHHSIITDLEREYEQKKCDFDLAKAAKSLGSIVAENDDSIADMIVRTLGIPNPTHSIYKVLKENFVK